MKTALPEPVAGWRINGIAPPVKFVSSPGFAIVTGREFGLFLSSTRPLMNVPDSLLYCDSHEWIDPATPEAAPVGISDHAQEELTDVVYLELPAVGRVVAKGEPFAVIESVKAANDIYAPVSGEVVAVNGALVESPEAVNTDPYGAGWMVKIRLSDPSELSGLKNAESYREFLS